MKELTIFVVYRIFGGDEIPSEILKAGGLTVIRILTKLFNKLLSSGEIPKIWKNADMVVLHKRLYERC